MEFLWTGCGFFVDVFGTFVCLFVFFFFFFENFSGFLRISWRFFLKIFEDFFGDFFEDRPR